MTQPISPMLPHGSSKLRGADVFPTEGIPCELRDLPQWVCWRFEERNGRATKPPYQCTGRAASHTNPDTWCAFSDAVAAFERGGFEGIGFVFSESDPYIGIDLDNAIDDEGKVKPWAAEIVELFGSWTEVSPSGKGIHIIARGVLQGGGRKAKHFDGSVEVYDRLRYFTIRGCPVDDSPIRDAQDVLDKLVSDLFPPVEPEARAASKPTAPPPTDKLAHVRNAVRVMLAGTTQGKRSEVDYKALCKLIEAGIGQDDAWEIVHDMSKFATDGQGYFNRTWSKAAANAKAPDPEFRPVITDVCAADVAPKDIEWLWLNRFPLGMFSIVSGEGKVGKGMLLVAIASRVSRGVPFHDAQDQKCEPATVAFLAEEDPLEYVAVPRLKAAEADLSRIRFPRGVQRTAETEPEDIKLRIDADTLADYIRQHGVKLLVIDPINNYLPAKCDTHNDASVRDVLMSVSRIAEATGCAIIGIMHHKKGSGPASERIIGSVAYRNVPRACWALSKDPANHRRRLLLNNDSNLPVTESGLAFTIENGAVCWDATPVNMSAAEAADEARRANTAEGGLGDAMDWLVNALAAGPVKQKEVEAAARAEMISFTTLKRAKDKLNVQSKKGGMSGPWFWSLPVEEDHEEDQPKSWSSSTNAIKNEVSAPLPVEAFQPKGASPQIDHLHDPLRISSTASHSATEHDGICPDIVPDGWTPSRWACELRRKAEACEQRHPEIAARYREWAARLEGLLPSATRGGQVAFEKTEMRA